MNNLTVDEFVVEKIPRLLLPMEIFCIDVISFQIGYNLVTLFLN